MRAAVAVAAAVAVVLAAVTARAHAGADGPATVTLTVHHSRFTPAVVEVQPGATVRFVVRNTDPIDHELIVGPAEVHQRHETGTEAHHGDRPGEVSVPAGTTASTTYRFPTEGDVVFACHLPGHAAYGMTGVVLVRRSS